METRLHLIVVWFRWAVFSLSGFLENAKFVGVDKMTCKNCNKSSWMQVNKILFTRDRPEQFPSVFVHSFQCSWNSQGIFIDNWSRNFSIYKKNLSSGFLENAKFVGVDQITCKSCNKSSWMQVNKILLTRDRPEQFPSVFVRSFQWNQTTMRWSRVSNAYRFLLKLANCVDSMLFQCLYDA